MAAVIGQNPVYTRLLSTITWQRCDLGAWSPEEEEEEAIFTSLLVTSEAEHPSELLQGHMDAAVGRGRGRGRGGVAGDGGELADLRRPHVPPDLSQPGPHLAREDAARPGSTPPITLSPSHIHGYHAARPCRPPPPLTWVLARGRQERSDRLCTLIFHSILIIAVWVM